MPCKRVCNWWASVCKTSWLCILPPTSPQPEAAHSHRQFLLSLANSSRFTVHNKLAEVLGCFGGWCHSIGVNKAHLTPAFLVRVSAVSLVLLSFLRSSSITSPHQGSTTSWVGQGRDTARVSAGVGGKVGYPARDLLRMLSTLSHVSGLSWAAEVRRRRERLGRPRTGPGSDGKQID